MKLHLLPFLTLLFMNHCTVGTDASQRNIPDCMLEKIVALQKEQLRNPPAYLAGYQYKGQQVYYIPAAAGDRMSELYTAGCELLCHPEGGITGRGDGKCPGFLEERSGEEIIWRDERK